MVPATRDRCGRRLKEQLNLTYSKGSHGDKAVAPNSYVQNSSGKIFFEKLL